MTESLRHPTRPTAKALVYFLITEIGWRFEGRYSCQMYLGQAPESVFLSSPESSELTARSWAKGLHYLRWHDIFPVDETTLRRNRRAAGLSVRRPRPNFAFRIDEFEACDGRTREPTGDTTLSADVYLNDQDLEMVRLRFKELEGARNQALVLGFETEPFDVPNCPRKVSDLGDPPSFKTHYAECEHAFLRKLEVSWQITTEWLGR